MPGKTATLVFPFQFAVPLELPDEYINLREHEPVVRVSLPTGGMTMSGRSYRIYDSVGPRQHGLARHAATRS